MNDDSLPVLSPGPEGGHFPAREFQAKDQPTFLYTKQGRMLPGLTGGAVNFSGGIHDYRKGSYNFLY